MLYNKIQVEVFNSRFGFYSHYYLLSLKCKKIRGYINVKTNLCPKLETLIPPKTGS